MKARHYLILSALLCAACAKTIELPPAADEAARRSLKLIDQHQYAESWQQASHIFRDAVTEEAWLSSVTRVRKPHGDFLERLQRTAAARTDPVDSPPGDYILITYDSKFSESLVVETLVMYLEEGQWRMAGYFLK